jgi:hypothetical protein
MKPMRAKLFCALAVVLTAAGAFAQSNRQVPGPTDYTAFSQFITDRNIFDPNRQPHDTSRPHFTRPTTTIPASAPAFTLVGTMSYQKGIFAFFNGNQDDLKKALSVSEKIAGYMVAKIDYGRVTLEATNQDQQLELKVGDVMREENGKWEMTGPGDLSIGTSSTGTDAGAAPANTSGGTGTTPASASAPNDILKRLMEKREQENK